MISFLAKSEKTFIMKRTFKRTFAALIAATTMAVGMSGMSASASGDVDGTRSGSGSNTKMTYEFDVDGNYVSRTNNNAHYGQTSTSGFSVSKDATYTISFSGLSVAAKVYIYEEDTNSLAFSFTIPKYQSGMPTLYTTPSLDAGQYYVKVVSNSYSTYTVGSFIVHGVSGSYTHSI